METHIHTCIYTHMHGHTHKCKYSIYACTCKNTYTHINMYIHSTHRHNACIHMHAHMSTHTCNTYTQCIHMHMQIYIYACTHVHAQHTQAHILAHTCVYNTHIHEQTGTHKHTYPYANVCMYTCKFTHMHAYMYTHTVIVIMCQLYKNMFGELVKYYCWVCL